MAPISSSPACADSVLPSPTQFLLGKHLARSRIYQRAVQDMQATNLCVYSCEFVRVLMRMCMCTCAHTTSKSIAIKEVSYGRRTHIYIVMTSIHVHAYAKTIMSRQTRTPDIIYRTIIIDEFCDRVWLRLHAEFDYIRANSDSNGHKCCGSRAGTRLPSSSHDGTRTIPATALVVRRHPTVVPGQHAAFASTTCRLLYLVINHAKSQL